MAGLARGNPERRSGQPDARSVAISWPGFTGRVPSITFR